MAFKCGRHQTLNEEALNRAKSKEYYEKKLKLMADKYDKINSNES